MSMRIHGVATVVIGHFNPWIIRPEWLREHEIVPAGDVQVTFAAAGTGKTFQFKVDDLDWKVSDDRLIVESDEPRNTGEYAVSTLKKLPHTPVVAIGHNLNYVCQSDVWSAGKPGLGNIDDRALGRLGSLRALSWQVSIVRPDDSVMNVKTHHTESQIAVSFNFHRQVADNKQAIQAARKFESDAKLAKVFVMRVLGQEVV